MATKTERQQVYPWLPFLTLAIWMLSTERVDALGCFVCSSINRSEPECDDPFNNDGRFYVEDCWARRQNRKGLFPATQCIKMIAENQKQLFDNRACSCLQKITYGATRLSAFEFNTRVWFTRDYSNKGYTWINAEDKTTYVVRKCVADNGGLTSETEIGRVDHCGWLREMQYDGKNVNGCIVTCEENGCNSGDSMKLSMLSSILGQYWSVLFFFFR